MYICVYVELLSLSPSAVAVISNVIAIVFAGPGPNGQQLGFYWLLLLLLQFFALFGSWQVEGFNIFMHAKRICAALIASLCPAAAPVACSAIMQRQFRINCSFVLLHWLSAALCQAQCPCG